VTDEQIQENNEILAAFLDAVLEGGPVPHDIAAAAWGVWASRSYEDTPQHGPDHCRPRNRALFRETAGRRFGLI